MISLKTKVDSKTSLPISDKLTDKEPTLSFSELLKGVSAKGDEKTIQNGTLILSSADDKEIPTKLDLPKEISSKDSLLSLLKGDEKIIEKNELLLELNPKATAGMDTKEIKVLIKDAKEYLKEQIINSDGYKKSKIKELPQTLKGLVTLAKDLKIDISKISVESVQIKDSKELVILNEKQNIKAVNLKEILSTKIQATPTITDSKEIPTPKILTTQTPTDSKEILTPKIPTTQTPTDSKEIPTTQKIESPIEKDINNLKSTPLFKAQTTQEHSTQQLVQTKQFKNTDEVHKAKTTNNDMLKQLLNIDKTHRDSSNIDSTLSIKTVKMVDTTITNDTDVKSSKSLEQLLRGESSTNTNTPTKIDGLNIPKSDSLDVKLHEAKQMIKYISTDVKNAIEDYKSPFTRIKVQLNPQKLGEIDLTVIQRGKNLHVNLSSNNVAINTLAQNINELRVQLNNSGINNATLSFNNSSQNPDSNQHQGQREQQRDARREYNYFEDEEKNEEILNSLEIIVPRYI